MELNGEESMIEELIEDKPIFKIKNKNTGVLERKVLVECEDCKKQRFQRIDKFKHRKSDLCHYCNSKKNITTPIHNLSSTRCYQKYMNMLHRCYTPTNKSFEYYGGRGIGVDFEWLGVNGFINFYNWCIKSGWSEEKTCKLQIDRIDNDQDYSPTNCQLISQLQNLKKMNNLFGVKGRRVKKKEESMYADVLEKIINAEATETPAEKPLLVPLWDWLENLGKNIKRN